jgi:hypothetical protein
MKTVVFTNTLAGFKSMIESAKTNGIYIKSSILRKDGSTVRENDFAPISIAQSNCFAIKREKGDSYTEYGKASTWEIDLHNNKVKKVFPDGYLEFQFQDPTFFGY